MRSHNADCMLPQPNLLSFLADSLARSDSGGSATTYRKCDCPCSSHSRSRSQSNDSVVANTCGKCKFCTVFPAAGTNSRKSSLTHKPCSATAADPPAIPDSVCHGPRSYSTADDHTSSPLNNPRPAYAVPVPPITSGISCSSTTGLHERRH